MSLKSKPVFVTGHKNPDTDSVCSSIAYAALKNRLGEKAVPVRIGKINRETEFVLGHFGFEVPEYLATVKTQVSDLDMDEIEPVSPDTSIREAFHRLKKSKLEVLPVENENRVLIGIVSVSDIANAYMSMPGRKALSISRTPIDNVLKTLDAHLLLSSKKTLEDSGKIVIAAMTPDGMDEYVEKGDIVFTGNIKANQIKAIEAGAGCLIVTCGSEVTGDVKKLAEQRGCTIITTEYDTFTGARLIYQSIPVFYTMTSKNIVSFHIDDFVDDVREKMLRTRFRSYPVVDEEGRFKGFISRYHLLNQKKKKVILMDHGEISQSVNGIEQADILEIIDHHRIGSVQTGGPIYYRNEPVGSTATIVANLYSEQGIKPPEKIAGLLCAAIISDTIKFKSPTSTHADLITAQRLSLLAGINIDDFSAKMFQQGSSLKNLSVKEIIESDFKEYEIGKYKVGIGQANITDLRIINKMRQALLGGLCEISEKGRYNILLMIFTDIIEESTQVLFFETQKGLVSRAFSPLNDENSFYMSGVVSRKKQIVPKLISALS